MGNANNQWLQRAEYASLLTSAIGTVAAAVSQQVVFAAAPLSMSLALNVLNRERFQKQSQRDTQAVITQVDTQVQKRFDGVQQQLQALPPPPDSFDLTNIHTQLVRTQEAIVNLQKDAETTVTGVRHYVDSELQILQRQLQTEISQIPPFNPQYLEEKIEQVGSTITQLSQGLAAVEASLIPLQAIDLNPLQQEVSQLQISLQSQAEGSEARSTSLQAQLSQLTQQIEQLEQVNRTIVQPHISELEVKLKTTSEATAILSKQLEVLNHQVSTKAERQKVAELIDAVLQLQQQLERLPSPPEPFNPAPLEADIEGLRSQTHDLRQQVQEVRLSITELGTDERLGQVGNAIINLEQKSQQFLTRQELTPWQQTIVDRVDHGVTSLKMELEMLNQAFVERPEQSLVQYSDEIQQQIQDMEAWLKDLDTSFEALHDRTQALDSMQHQIKQLIAGSGRISELETTLASLSEALVGQVDEAVDRRITELNQLLGEIQPGYEYKLIYNRDESRKILLNAVKKAQHRLILVCPWPHWGILWNSLELLNYLRTFLNIRKGQADIGWGYLQDINEVGLSSGSVREKLKAMPRSKYDGLSQLEDLENNYPGTVRLKLLGTHEKFLVCDRQFAMLGSHNFLTSSDKSEERELGLYTTDRRIIDELIKRFESAENLERKPISTPFVNSSPSQDAHFRLDYYERCDSFHS
ncbi:MULTISPECIES: phospholipase D-like domain-containing protein [Trichocoleus]|uniref:Phospholipase D-like domain-containing protein n=1 Tax=Trichocoleus desertorum GB2-A4 TaxID=2933944 RepID=A0ABV0JFP4_9CYAN|nr:phospholipase D-like domain-containing protein [Trichocoleus sp. FACHB-46]MBD1865699.1 hypothetical protein [Trichocoleus sp. FACHB-46]